MLVVIAKDTPPRRPAVPPGYHTLPDRGPYLYFRTPYGQRMLFPKAEIKEIDHDGSRIILTTIFDCDYFVTSARPELVSGTYAEQLAER